MDRWTSGPEDLTQCVRRVDMSRVGVMGAARVDSRVAGPESRDEARSRPDECQAAVINCQKRVTGTVTHNVAGFICTRSSHIIHTKSRRPDAKTFMQRDMNHFRIGVRPRSGTGTVNVE